MSPRMSRAEAERRIKAAAPWATEWWIDVTLMDPKLWIAEARAPHVGLSCDGRSIRVAVERFERVIKSGNAAKGAKS